MIILLIFSFLAGVVTILSPCILPILPIVLTGSVTGGKRRPVGVVLGFVISFTFFTLFLTSIVQALGISANFLRNLSVVVIFLFGLALIIPGFQKLAEMLFAKLSRLTPNAANKNGFSGGLLIGLSIGLLWTPCVGPILGSVISLALSGSVTGSAALITFAYSIGTAIPMLAIVWGGRNLLNKVPWLLANTAKIQRVFGILMILTAVAIYFNYDRIFQTYVLDKFPSYGTGLTSFEDNIYVNSELENLKGGDQIDKQNMGKPMNELLNSGGTPAPELVAGGKWFNSDPLKISELKGKVVLVDFWTYTCINCIRTLPYMRDWHAKYADKGLVIIGVHTPEFEFEKSSENVQKAIDDFDLKYPVMQDNNYTTWRAYDNHYWPAKYLIDKDGKIRYTHFGEGKYDETEEAIQELLAEAGSQVDENIDNPSYSIDTRTPELYLGYGRMGYFAEPSQLREDKKFTYTLPDEIAINHFAYGGEWTVEEERAMPEKDAELVLGFDAKDVFLVMRASGEGKVKVLLDGKPIDKDVAGSDVVDGIVTVTKDRLYTLVKLGQEGQHYLKLEFLDPGVELYAFTFG
jgi:cytochrome c biogenesis protein CcdA/thiol-disulfide isomerase/thioredoxin